MAKETSTASAPLTPPATPPPAAPPSAKPVNKLAAALSLAVSALKAAHAALQKRTDDQNALDALEAGTHELAAVENAEVGHLERAHGVLGLAVNLLANHSVDAKHLLDARTAQAAVAVHLPAKPAE